MTKQIDPIPTTNMSKKKPPFVLVLVIVGLLSLGLGWTISQFVENTSNSKQIPLAQNEWNEFLNSPWKTPEGEPADTQGWRGKTLVVNFWGSWCPPCVEEMPMLAKVSQELASQNVVFVGIGIDSPSNIRDFLKKTPVPYPIVIGGLDGNRWAKQFGNDASGLPFTAIIAPNGNIIYKKLGKIEEKEIKSNIFR